MPTGVGRFGLPRTKTNRHKLEDVWVIRFRLVAGLGGGVGGSTVPGLAALLRLVFNTAALRQAGAGRPSIKAPIKAKSPAIVHNQGISRQPPKFSNAAVGRVTPCAPLWQTQTPSLAGNPMNNLKILVSRRRRAEDCPPYLASPIRPGMMAGFGGGVGGSTVPGVAALLRLVFNTATLRSGRSIKAKTPAIVHDQGISRQPPKFPNAPVHWTFGAWHMELHVHPSPFAPLRLCAFALKSGPASRLNKIHFPGGFFR